MIFSSISFIYYFLPIVLVFYFIAPKKIKNFVLLVASLLFYFYGEPIYIFLMVGTILVTYIFGLLLDKFKKTKYQKIILVIGVVIILSSLLLFKYSDFLITNINSLFKSNISLLNLALPLGISFYTFQVLSYLIDVYKGKVECQKNFINLATYVCLFPQLIAGPIVRYKDVNDELLNRKSSIHDIAYGFKRFIIGLAKKVIISNSLASFVQIFIDSGGKSVLFYILYGISVTLQIYFDFSGYSDMAIGLGRIFGFHFLENFDYPLCATSITDFWRKWHISLSSWFRDYVYIPLGGSRTTKGKWLRNILIVWFLTGLWHGADWNFIIWGLYFGVLLIIEKVFLQKVLDKMPKFLKHIYTIIIVVISFMIFNAPDLNTLLVTFKSLFGFNHLDFSNFTTIYYFKSYFIILIIAIIGATPIIKNFINKLRKNNKLNKVINVLEIGYMLVLLILVTAYLVDGSFNPFIYFRF